MSVEADPDSEDVIVMARDSFKKWLASLKPGQRLAALAPAVVLILLAMAGFAIAAPAIPVDATPPHTDYGLECGTCHTVLDPTPVIDPTPVADPVPDPVQVPDPVPDPDEHDGDADDDDGDADDDDGDADEHDDEDDDEDDDDDESQYHDGDDDEEDETDD